MHFVMLEYKHDLTHDLTMWFTQRWTRKWEEKIPDVLMIFLYLHVNLSYKIGIYTTFMSIQFIQSLSEWDLENTVESKIRWTKLLKRTEWNRNAMTTPLTLRNASSWQQSLMCFRNQVVHIGRCSKVAVVLSEVKGHLVNDYDWSVLGRLAASQRWDSPVTWPPGLEARGPYGDESRDQLMMPWCVCVWLCVCVCVGSLSIWRWRCNVYP